MIDAASPTRPSPVNREDAVHRLDAIGDRRHNKPSGFAGRMAVTTACHIFAALAFSPAGSEAHAGSQEQDIALHLRSSAFRIVVHVIRADKESWGQDVGYAGANAVKHSAVRGPHSGILDSHGETVFLKTDADVKPIIDAPRAPS